jgi:aconitate hydratase A / 2-methylisocitrate dehydratase
MLARIDTPEDVEYIRHGGVLPYVLRGLLRAFPAAGEMTGELSTSSYLSF